MNYFLILFIALTSSLVAWDCPNLWNLAVQEQGRKKPVSTLTYEAMVSLSGRSTIKNPETGQKYTAQEVILGIWFNPEPWKKIPMIQIGYRPLIQSLGLDARESRFSFEAIQNNSMFLQKLKEVRDLRMRKANPTLTREQKEIESVSNRLTLFENLSLGKSFEIVPHPNQVNGHWASIHQTADFYGPAIAQTIQSRYEGLRQSYLENQQAVFSERVLQLSEDLRSLSPTVYPSMGSLSREYRYQELHPFRKAWICYAVALLVLLLTTRWAVNKGYIVSWILILMGFGFQVYGFVARILISGRAPVTNMYETVLWCAFIVVLIALVLEAIYRKRQFLLAACPVAIISLILADSLSAIFNSSIHPLVPVLRNNFWLTVHVLSITSSYAAFALSLGMSHMVLWKIAIQNRKSEKETLFLYNYRTLQIGVFLIATGTLLGAVWANYSWGRFWDWDPKETWALIAFLAYLIILHGKLAGWWKDLGVAVGSIIAFQTVLMAWYGVNFVLGVGLHSYGFGVGGFQYVLGYVVLELLFIAFALLKYKSQNRSLEKTSH